MVTYLEQLLQGCTVTAAGRFLVKQGQYTMRKRDFLTAYCLHSLHAIGSHVPNIHDMICGSTP